MKISVITAEFCTFFAHQPYFSVLICMENVIFFYFILLALKGPFDFHQQQLLMKWLFKMSTLTTNTCLQPLAKRAYCPLHGRLGQLIPNIQIVVNKFQK